MDEKRKYQIRKLKSKYQTFQKLFDLPHKTMRGLTNVT